MSVRSRWSCRFTRRPLPPAGARPSSPIRRFAAKARQALAIVAVRIRRFIERVAADGLAGTRSPHHHGGSRRAFLYLGKTGRPRAVFPANLHKRSVHVARRNDAPPALLVCCAARTASCPRPSSSRDRRTGRLVVTARRAPHRRCAAARREPPRRRAAAAVRAPRDRARRPRLARDVAAARGRRRRRDLRDGLSDAAERVNKLRRLFGVACSGARSTSPASARSRARSARAARAARRRRPAAARDARRRASRGPSDEDTKAALGAADIPIVRLNPFGIPGRRWRPRRCARARRTASCARAASTTSGRRAGRSSAGRRRRRPRRADVADVLAAALGELAAARKTFEMPALRGMSRRASAPAARLAHDGAPRDAPPSRPSTLLQQLRPGEADATQLEMGRTYEQVDGWRPRRAKAARRRRRASRPRRDRRWPARATRSRMPRSRREDGELRLGPAVDTPPRREGAY